MTVKDGLELKHYAGQYSSKGPFYTNSLIFSHIHNLILSLESRALSCFKEENFNCKLLFDVTLKVNTFTKLQICD